jgi:hypothetical protein
MSPGQASARKIRFIGSAKPAGNRAPAAAPEFTGRFTVAQYDASKLLPRDKLARHLAAG